MEDLLDILKNFFVPRFCLENYPNLISGSDKEFRLAFPMTCFCDLPLSQLHEHLDFYGGYGIGLKKEWGIVNKINPVLYLHQNSDLSSYIRSLLAGFREGRDRNKGNGNENAGFSDTSGMFSILSILRHVKLYDGYVKDGRRDMYKRFYDEREWRWVPFLTDNKNTDILSLTEEEFNDLPVRLKADSEVAGMAKLSFAPNDIKYIVVSAENEIMTIMKLIERIYESYDIELIKLLYTKIVSAEQIKEDF